METKSEQLLAKRGLAVTTGRRHSQSQQRQPVNSLTASRRNKTFTLAERERHRRSTKTSASIAEGDLDKMGADEEYLDGSGTPTPSEKVSRWHRDIFLVSPPSSGSNPQQVHPRQCLCEQCMAEYGTFKFYNDMLNGKDANRSKDAAAVSASKAEEAGEVTEDDSHVGKKRSVGSIVSAVRLEAFQMLSKCVRHSFQFLLSVVAKSLFFANDMETSQQPRQKVQLHFGISFSLSFNCSGRDETGRRESCSSKTVQLEPQFSF